MYLNVFLQFASGTSPTKMKTLPPTPTQGKRLPEYSLIWNSIWIWNKHDPHSPSSLFLIQVIKTEIFHFKSCFLLTFPASLPVSLPSLPNAQSTPIAPEFLGGNSNRGSIAHLIYNKCVFAACGGRNVHCLLELRARWPHAHSFSKVFFFCQ